MNSALEPLLLAMSSNHEQDTLDQVKMMWDWRDASRRPCSSQNIQSLLVVDDSLETM